MFVWFFGSDDNERIGRFRRIDGCRRRMGEEMDSLDVLWR